MKKIAIWLICLVSLMTVSCGSLEKTKASGPEKTEAASPEMPDEPETVEPSSEPGTTAHPEAEQGGESRETGEAGTEVSQGGPYGEISITLPEGWAWEACPMDSGKLISGMYGIQFYPEGMTEGYVELFYVDLFGVCGTGLKEEKRTIAGASASVGTYDNHTYWDYVAFQEDCEGIVASTYLVESWWSEYGGQVMDILDTLSFDQGVKGGGAYIDHEDSEISEIALYMRLEKISSTGAIVVFHQYDAEAPTGELTYGDDFKLEVLQDENWEEVPVIVEGNYGFHQIAYTVPPEESIEQEINWEWLYGELPPGEYRISKTVHDFRASGDYDVYTICGRFVLR